MPPDSSSDVGWAASIVGVPAAVVDAVPSVGVPAAEVLPVADGDGRVELRVALGDGEVDRVEEVPPVLVRGAVPGARNGTVIVRRPKARTAGAGEGGS